MNGRLKGSTVYITAALGLGLAVPGYAQTAQSAAPTADPGGPADNGINEVIVTARRMEERAQDVPISMTILDQKQLSDRHITTAGDLATFTPSMSVDNQFGQDVTSFSIRGFVQAVQTTPSVAVYFADAVVPRGGNVGEPAGSGVAPGSFFDLQNVEVLKGPQGTLFGRNTDGGAVLLVPKKPTSEFEGYVQGSYGNYSMNAVEGVLNVPLGDRVRLRLGANHEERNGYVNNISGIGPKDFSNTGYTAARLGLVVDVTNDVENYLLGMYNLSVNNGTLPQLFACNPAIPSGATLCAATLQVRQASKDPYAVINDLPGVESYLRQLQVVNTTTWHASDNLTIKNILNYGELRTALKSSLFGAYLLPGATGFTAFLSSSSDPYGLGGLTTDQYTASEELQFQGSLLENKLTWQAGAYLERSGPKGTVTGSRSGNFLTCLDLATFQCAGPGVVDDNTADIHFNDQAVYAQLTYQLTDQLKLTGGLRYTDDKTSSTFHEITYLFLQPFVPFAVCTSQLPGVTVATGCTQHFDQSSSAPTYLIDLDYTPVQDLLLYAKYARGYRQGGVATFVADGYHTYGPEHVNSFELGQKATFSGALRGTFNTALFYNDFTDQQLLAGFVGPQVSPSSGIVNAGKSRIWGVELESAITPVRPLTVGLSYTYLHTELVQTRQTALPSGAYNQIIFASVVGGELPFSPKNKASAYFNYRLPVPDHLGRVTLGANFTYTSSQLTTANSPLATIPPYGLLGMNLHWDAIGGSPIDAELFVSNLTDRLYYTNTTQLYNTPFGFESRWVGEPRMYGGRIRVNFGK